jgi:hypothetical protein
MMWAHEVLVINLSDVVGGNHDIAEALAPQEKERNVPAFNRVITVIVGISASFADVGQ